MYLVGDRPEFREKRIRDFLAREPAIAVILAAVHFEWTASRAILFLGRKANTELRETLQKNCSGLAGYKKCWLDEVVCEATEPKLNHIVTNWFLITEAFDLRNGLVHGRDTCTRNTATPHVEALLQGARCVAQFCLNRGADLSNRMPVRRKWVEARLRPKPGSQT
jgi:hypothetical protein